MRRRVIESGSSSFNRRWFRLSCGHTVSYEGMRRLKTTNCGQCVRGECVTHDWQLTDVGATCRVCGLKG